MSQKYKRKIIEARIEICKKKIEWLLEKKENEKAAELIEGLSAVLYTYNQIFSSKFIENCLKKISEKIKNTRVEGRKKRVLFYDGVGNIQRGILYEYVDFFTKRGYCVYYICDSRENVYIEKIKTFKLGSTYILNRSEEIQNIVKNISPEMVFIYAQPYDVAGVVAFMRISGPKRFYINHADHAFWIGKNCMDICIEYRDYGASISFKYRGIPKDKIRKVRFYPYIDHERKFEGFPFKKEKNDFIIFSGGSLYKTFDSEETYYKMVQDVLNINSSVKFWYAGNKISGPFIKLLNKNNGRVFFTKERKDFFAVLQHVDLFLNTYPLPGGQMMQYACAAGKVPLTLKHGNDGDGFIIGREHEYISREGLLQDIKKYIFDSEYRRNMEQETKKKVWDEKNFDDDLINCIDGNRKQKVTYYDPDISAMRSTFYDNFHIYSFDYLLFNKDNPKIRVLYPFSFLVCGCMHLHSWMIEKYLLWREYDCKKSN